jgi:hypothetical protein
MAKRYGQIGSRAFREASHVLGRFKIPAESPKSAELENVAVQ